MSEGSREGSDTDRAPNTSPQNQAQKNFFFFFQWSNAEALETDVVPITLASWPQTIYLTSRGPFPLLEKAEEANLAKGL